MTLGMGIAIAAIWGLPIAACFAKDVSGVGLAAAIMAAIVGTIIIAINFGNSGL